MNQAAVVEELQAVVDKGDHESVTCSMHHQAVVSSMRSETFRTNFFTSYLSFALLMISSLGIMSNKKS